MSKELRIIFAGTPHFAAYHLNALLLSGYKVVGVFTQPDRPAGRGKKLMSSPIKKLAEVNRLPVFQPTSLCTRESQQLIIDLKVDIMVVVAYGLIIPKTMLTIPHLGCINIHSSLLPRWRGAAPIQRALLAGDIITGITIIQMDAGIDTGNILYKMQCSISSEDTSATLYFKLAYLGAQGLIEILKQLAAGTTTPEIQNNSLATYAEKLNKEEARINWYMPAVKLERYIRAFNPWPISWFMIDGHLIKIWKASVIYSNSDTKPGSLLKASKNGIQVATTDGILNLELLQPAGKKIMRACDILNFHREWFISGKHFT